MEYLSKLTGRAFSDTWNLVFDRSFWSAMIALGIFFSTFWYLRCRKQHEEAKRALRDFGIAALITAAAFLAVFLLHVLFFTPAALYSEEHAAKSVAENAKAIAEGALNALKTATPAPPPQFEITETDRQARKQLKETREELKTAQEQLNAANEKIRQLDPKEQPIASITASSDVLLISEESSTIGFWMRAAQLDSVVARNCCWRHTLKNQLHRPLANSEQLSMDSLTFRSVGR